MEPGHYQTVIDLVVPLFASAGEKPGFALAAAMARMAVKAGFEQGEETQPTSRRCPTSMPTCRNTSPTTRTMS